MKRLLLSGPTHFSTKCAKHCAIFRSFYNDPFNKSTAGSLPPWVTATTSDVPGRIATAIPNTTAIDMESLTELNAEIEGLLGSFDDDQGGSAQDGENYHIGRKQNTSSSSSSSSFYSYSSYNNDDVFDRSLNGLQQQEQLQMAMYPDAAAAEEEEEEDVDVDVDVSAHQSYYEEMSRSHSKSHSHSRAAADSNGSHLLSTGATGPFVPGTATATATDTERDWSMPHFEPWKPLTADPTREKQRKMPSPSPLSFPAVVVESQHQQHQHELEAEPDSDVVILCLTELSEFREMLQPKPLRPKQGPVPAVAADGVYSLASPSFTVDCFLSQELDRRQQRRRRSKGLGIIVCVPQTLALSQTQAQTQAQTQVQAGTGKLSTSPLLSASWTNYLRYSSLSVPVVTVHYKHPGDSDPNPNPYPDDLRRSELNTCAQSAPMAGSYLIYSQEGDRGMLISGFSLTQSLKLARVAIHQLGQQ